MNELKLDIKPGELQILLCLNCGDEGMYVVASDIETVDFENEEVLASILKAAKLKIDREREGHVTFRENRVQSTAKETH